MRCASLDALLAEYWPGVLGPAEQAYIYTNVYVNVYAYVCKYVNVNIYVFIKQRLDQGNALGSFCVKLRLPSCQRPKRAAGGQEGRRRPAYLCCFKGFRVGREDGCRGTVTTADNDEIMLEANFEPRFYGEGRLHNAALSLSVEYATWNRAEP
jgi:hypothetical protein